MFGEKIVDPRRLPIIDKDRASTDVCCTIIGAIIALTMFIVACCMWNKGSTIFIQTSSTLLSTDAVEILTTQSNAMISFSTQMLTTLTY